MVCIWHIQLSPALSIVSSKQRSSLKALPIIRFVFVINATDNIERVEYSIVAQEPTKRIKKPTPLPRTGKWESVKPKPIPCKSVNEDLILPPPDGYKPIPKPMTDRPLEIPKIKELNQALKGHEK